jgi:hypothetical protein
LQMSQNCFRFVLSHTVFSRILYKNSIVFLSTDESVELTTIHEKMKLQLHSYHMYVHYTPYLLMNHYGMKHSPLLYIMGRWMHTPYRTDWVDDENCIACCCLARIVWSDGVCLSSGVLEVYLQSYPLKFIL